MKNRLLGRNYGLSSYQRNSNYCLQAHSSSTSRCPLAHEQQAIILLLASRSARVSPTSRWSTSPLSTRTSPESEVFKPHIEGQLLGQVERARLEAASLPLEGKCRVLDNASPTR